MSAFKPLQASAPQDKRHNTQRWESFRTKSGWLPPFNFSVNDLNTFRDQLTISSWLALGACFQGLAYLLFGRLAFLPAGFLLFYRTADAFLQAAGWKSNPMMKDVILTKFSAQLPDENGDFGAQASREEICVLLIGTRINHPLGIIGPGVQEIGTYFNRMSKELEHEFDTYGMLGITEWTANERPTGNEILQVCYFKNAEGLHKFAHGPTHRAGWDWWNRTIASHPHISIWHEIYHVPAQRWETIYANSSPTLLGGCRVPIVTKSATSDGTEKRWMRPLVDATRGPLRTSRGRMGVSRALEHEGYRGYEYVGDVGGKV
ncbi:hypothetical protein M501DRAFT_975861 [Patellaria atrata CBS 101060]|uniref:Uncharacterized protein n=1 Tax=Patellaria atrata CBS 101060 TaxID=1346257 RepID=A0A9P4SC37_9PEZI|nr:hypothetical protein M501DRAFT_975861 [Patellaria atrata CBS 101060]